MPRFSILLSGLSFGAQVLAQDTVKVPIPSGLATRQLATDVYGYSIEPIWVDSYISTPLATTLLGQITNVTGKSPPIRVGGNTADQTYIHNSLSTGNNSVALPGLPNANMFNITPAWYDTWARYFPQGTDFVYTLNLAVNTSAWADALSEAEAVSSSLGDTLKLFELGNEIDHFIHKGWRNGSWDVKTYLEQFRNLTDQITSSPWYQSTPSPPKFQAGVFADPPLVPDQQDELDDFSIANLTAAETAQDREIIGSYATHLYPQSTCDTARWYRMRLDLLSNHTVLWLNVSQYIPQVAAADAAGSAPLVMGETNSVSCSGKSGISDTFGAALWGVDYILTAASLGFAKVYFHLGATSEYSSFTPRAYDLKGEHLQPGIRAGWYGHYFIAKTVASSSSSSSSLRIAALPGANSSDLSGFAIYDGQGSSSPTPSSLRKLVFLDMGVWNGTAGLSNPSTLSATDGKMFSTGARPNRTLSVATPWCAGRSVRVTRLTAPGTNAKNNVSVSGVTFDPATGQKLGNETVETLRVGSGGVLPVGMTRAEGVLLEVVGGNATQCASAVVTADATGRRGSMTSIMGILVSIAILV